MAKGVPSKADIENLSKIASSGRTSSSDTSSKPGAVAQKPRLNRLRTVDTLPCHGLAQLKNACQLRGERHVPHEEDSEAVPPCDLKDFQNLSQYLMTMR